MRRKNGYEPQPVRLGHTFAILMEREGFVELCHNGRTVETQPAATIDLFETFPPGEEKHYRTLQEYSISFMRVIYVDENERNIFTTCLRG